MNSTLVQGHAQPAAPSAPSRHRSGNVCHAYTCYPDRRRIPKSKLVPYVDDRPDLDQKFTPLQAPTSVDFGRKPGDPKEPRKRVVLHMRMSTWERVSRRADRQGLRPTIIVARLLEAYGNREIDLAPHPSGIKVTPHRTTFANPDNPSNR